MKIRHYLSVLALAVGITSAHADVVPTYDYPDPGNFANLYGDFYSFSMPILSSAVSGFTVSSTNFNNSQDPYFINTANVIQSALVVGTGSGGNQSNQDLGLTPGTVSDGYDFPNLSGNATGTFTGNGWNITLDSLRQYLTKDGILYDLVAYFNNNQLNSTAADNNIWAKADVKLTNADGSMTKILKFQDTSSAEAPYVLSGGPVTLCFNWTDPTKTGNNDLRTEVSCNGTYDTSSTYEHNLGQGAVAYAITSLELNQIIHDLNSGYTKMFVDVSFKDLNNGFENLYLAAACINCGSEVPEPSSLALLGLALAGLGLTRARKS